MMLFVAAHESAVGHLATRLACFSNDRFRRIVLQNTAASFIWADLRIAQRSPLRASYGIIGLHAWQTGYAVQVTAADGGGRQRNLTRRRRF